MPKAVIPASSDHFATLRQLKALVVLLVISNIGLGLFASYLLRTTDERYSTLLGRSLPALNDLRAATAGSADVMRWTGVPLLSASDEQRPEMIRNATTAVARDRELRAAIIADPWPPEAPDARATLQRDGDAVDLAAERVIALAAEHHAAEATQLRERTFRPAVDAYLDAIGRAADSIQGASLHASDAMTARTGSMSNVVLGIATWPVVVLVGLLILTALFVVVLMVLFRGREMGDTP